jgi:hypothetical protein
VFHFCRNDGEGEKRNEFFLYSGVSVTVDEKITEFKQADVFPMAGCVCSLQVTVIGNGIFFQIGEKRRKNKKNNSSRVVCYMLGFFFPLKLLVFRNLVCF